MKKQILFNYQFMTAEKVGRFGIKQTDLDKMMEKLFLINKNLKTKKNDPALSFRELPYDTQVVKDIKFLTNKLTKKFDNLVVVGVGGSNLGAKTIYSALAGKYANQLPLNKKFLKLYFTGDTTDPQQLEDLLKVIDLKKTVFYIVSKSGSTIETTSTFLYLRKILIDKVGYKKHKDHFIITTNMEKGGLLEIAQKEDYLLLPHHEVGGRFSVLSVNGLLPAALAGFDIDNMLKGAKEIDRLCQKNNKNNLAYVYAALHYLAYKKNNQNILVLMPYSNRLVEFGNWFRQLIGESVANKKDLNKKQVNIGITPLVSQGPTDQHSQIQLYMEGPADKVISVLLVDKVNNNMQVPKLKDSDLEYLGGHKFKDILNIEQRATAVSLMKNKRPNNIILIPELNEFYLGQLFYFFEIATLYLGELFKVNVFDQPGVEQSKKYMYGLLGKEGYEKEKKEIKNIDNRQ